MTRPYAEVIGDPIGHSKSPLIHNFWLGKLGIDAEYHACHVTGDGLRDYFTRRHKDAKWRGCNVTIPHKEKVHSLIDGSDDRARAVGAVNTVYRDPADGLMGTNTDIDGVEAALSGLDLTGEEICVIGNGGAARAAFAALARRDTAAVHVLARDPAKAAKVANSFDILGVGTRLEAGSPALCEARLLINATQLGMSGQERMPGFVLSELDEMAEGALVFDMVYSPLETDLLAAARRKAIATADGLVMLIGQAAVAFEKFFGQPAPRQHDAELRRLLTS